MEERIAPAAAVVDITVMGSVDGADGSLDVDTDGADVYGSGTAGPSGADGSGDVSTP